MAETLLVEIGTEELPPAGLRRYAESFHNGLCHALNEAGLDHDAERSRWFATPRRLAVSLAAVADRQADRELNRRGPAVKQAFDDDGQPTRAAEGFAGSVGVSVDELERVDTPKGAYLLYRAHEPGKPLAELLPGMLETVLAGLPVERRMRWGDNPFHFIRPVHWLVALHGERVIEWTGFGLHAGRTTRGHRFHHPEPVVLDHADDFEAALEGAYVVADLERRRARIEAAVGEAARPHRARQTDALLAEVTALTEWPVALACRFDEAFLALPPEVLTTTLDHHERLFTVLDADDDPTGDFVAVANLESTAPERVREGFERVVRPRLADAAFFYDQDRRTPLADRRPALESVAFQKRLGSVADKSRRVGALAGALAAHLGHDTRAAERAAALCKCDLTTLMVDEFAELQGIMGGYYARHDGEPEAVAQAIGEHYRPAFAGDRIPASATGQILAAADKLDTVCGVIAAVGRPSGNKDPFALRRQALGVVRVLIEAPLDLDLAEWIDRALAESPVGGPDDTAGIRDFFMNRLKGYCREQGVPPDVFQAVRATGTTHLRDFQDRIEACVTFRDLPEAGALAAANKRVRNILKKADGGYPDRPDGAVLRERAERDLFEAVRDKRDAIEPLLSRHNYRDALAELAGLRASVDAFFDQVMVMAEDETLRRNRLALLSSMHAMFSRIADVSRLDLDAAP